MKALDLLLIYLERLQNYLSALSKSFFLWRQVVIIKDFLQNLMKERMKRWFNVILYQLEYYMQRDI